MTTIISLAGLDIITTHTVFFLRLRKCRCSSLEDGKLYNQVTTVLSYEPAKKSTVGKVMMRDDKLNYRHLNPLCLPVSKFTSGKQRIFVCKGISKKYTVVPRQLNLFQKC